MRSTFGGLEISKRSLFTHQTALTTTGHNIANANTRGYTRQTVNFVASKPIEAPGMMRSNAPGQLGQGVEFSSINRIRERFLDEQFYNENTSLGEWSVRQDTLEKLESIMNEPSDTGIRKVMDQFWNAWQELSKQPDNLESRAVVKESAIALADAFNHTYTKMSDLARDLNDNLAVKTTEVNSSLQMIARLNEEIFRIEGLGNNANDLRDQRDILVDDLSKVINVEVIEQTSGYQVRMGDTVLVEGRQATLFDAAAAEAGYTSGNLKSGQLFGLKHSVNVHLNHYQMHMNAMVKKIADAVNDVHSQGYTLQTPLTAGGPFFQYDVANPSASIKVHDDITSNVENIAASKRFYDDNGVLKVVKGNNELALELAGMKNNKYSFNDGGITGIILNNGTFDEFFRAVIGELGVQTQEAIRQTDNQQVLVEQVESRRQSVSGVSLDEEMANMIKFQHAYNAAARAMTTFDEMLDKVINSMGTVGR
jgi:flagellar hook-associated protein 1